MRDHRAPHPDAALVLQRWNGWVRLYWPASDETQWVNLDEVPGYELLREVPCSADVDEQPAESERLLGTTWPHGIP